MAIKYTPEFNRKIRSIVDAYNKRVSRLESKYPNSRRIPPHISVAGLKSNYENRGELISKLKQLESFNEDKFRRVVSVSTDNVRTNEYEYESFKLNKKVAQNKIQHLLDLNIKRDKKEGRFLPSHRTRSLRAQLKTLEKTNGKKFSYQSFLAARNIASRYSDRREESDKQFYENFFDMLWANQQYSELDADLVQQAHDMFEQLTPEQLLELYNSEPDVSRLVEDYHLYTDTQGYAITDEEAVRARVRFEMLMEELPDLIEKYKKY